MPKLTAHVSLWRDAETVHLSPGDELPEWAHGLVGAHVLSDDEGEIASETEDSEQDESADDEGEADQPDFTVPAPRRGRPRKQA